eukprot:scpid78410/ scgid30321/ 
MSFNRAVPLIPSTKKAQESAQTIVTLRAKRTEFSLFSFSSSKRIDTPGASSSFSHFWTIQETKNHLLQLCLVEQKQTELSLTVKEERRTSGKVAAVYKTNCYFKRLQSCTTNANAVSKIIKSAIRNPHAD